jgi:hypothetical protein
VGLDVHVLLGFGDGDPKWKENWRNRGYPLSNNEPRPRVPACLTRNFRLVNL